MKKYRKYAIILINIPLILLIFKAMYSDEPSDTNGFFVILVVFYMVFYNLYVLIVTCIIRNEENTIDPEMKYYILLLFPSLVLGYGHIFTLLPMIVIGFNFIHLLIPLMALGYHYF